MRVLLVEDNDRLSDLVTKQLEAKGHSVRQASSAEAGRSALADATFDAAIVDIGLPDGSGIELCREARTSGLDLPMLILTARAGVDSRVAGLDAGADDYLTKPFAAAELAARVRALGRRAKRWVESVRAYDDLVIDRDRRVVEQRGVRVPLTPRELDLVFLLAWRDGRVVAREEILETVWGEATASAASSLEVLIARLRRKLDSTGKKSVIRTMRQVGYAWDRNPSKRA